MNAGARPMEARGRSLLRAVADPGSWTPLTDALRTRDFLGFRDPGSYRARLLRARAATGLDEAFTAAALRIGGRAVLGGAYEFDFIGGGMGCVVGERIARLFHRATAEGRGLLILHRSGGARMQEGTWSLFQMAKVCAAVEAHRARGLPYVSVLMDPCMGGVLASSGALGDVVLAEAGARIGFAGPRVVHATLGPGRDPGDQSAEWLLRHGFVDRVFTAQELAPLLRRLLAPERPAPRLRSQPTPRDPIPVPEERMACIRRARALDRPRFEAWLRHLVGGFLELHGDRCAGDDPTLRGGLARLEDRDVLVVGTDRGGAAAQLGPRNFGMVRPCGYRKARRLFRVADRLGLPIVTLVDTPGADPGRAAERAGQGFAIAEALAELVTVRVPVVGLVIGEGGSGGAMAVASVDHLVMLEDTHLSVISPEGCAGLLWRRRDQASRAAQQLRSTARDLAAQGLADEWIPEWDAAGAREPTRVQAEARAALARALDRLTRIPVDRLLDRRRRRLHRDAALLG